MSPRLLRPRALGGFTPKNLTGLLGWWDASNATSVTLSGGFVSEWRDISGSGLHVSQSVEANRPGTTTVNGRTAIDFDGSNDYLERTSFSGTVGTVFTTHILDATNVAYGIYSFLRPNTPSGLYGMEMLFASANDYRTRGLTGSTSIFNSGVAGSLVARVTAHTYSGSASACSVDRAAMAGTSSSTFSNKETILFGSRFSNAYTLPMNGKMCEIVAYDRVLSAAEINRVESYLATKWGVTLA